LIGSADGIVIDIRKIQDHYPAQVYIPGFPDSMNPENVEMNILFLVDGNYIAELTLEVELRNDEVYRFLKRKELRVNEIQSIDVSSSGGLSKSFGRQWVFKNHEVLERLSKNDWDLTVVDIPEGQPVENSHLIQKSWNFLYGK
jgi:hypothetical protein